MRLLYNKFDADPIIGLPPFHWTPRSDCTVPVSENSATRCGLTITAKPIRSCGIEGCRLFSIQQVNTDRPLL